MMYLGWMILRTVSSTTAFIEVCNHSGCSAMQKYDQQANWVEGDEGR